MFIVRLAASYRSFFIAIINPTAAEHCALVCILSSKIEDRGLAANPLPFSLSFF
jgi:hypothetical protein